MPGGGAAAAAASPSAAGVDVFPGGSLPAGSCQFPSPQRCCRPTSATAATEFGAGAAVVVPPLSLSTPTTSEDGEERGNHSEPQQQQQQQQHSIQLSSRSSHGSSERLVGSGRSTAAAFEPQCRFSVEMPPSAAAAQSQVLQSPSGEPLLFRPCPWQVRALWLHIQRARGWIVTALIALGTALSAAWVEGGIRFLSDFRLGSCGAMFWLDKDFCCGHRTAQGFFASPRGCPAAAAAMAHMQDVRERSTWHSWSDLLGWGGVAIDYAAFVAISVWLAWFAAWLCCHLSRHAAGSGISEVKAVLQGFPLPHVLSPLTGLVKCVGLSLAVASGLSVGKEGPMVHIAGCFGAFFAEKLHSRHARVWVTASSAAGISVAFGAPLGGVLYALEEVAASFPLQTLWKSFFCAVVGALAIRWFDTGGTGSLTLFRMDSVALLGTWQLVELLPFAVIGLLGGLIGTAFIRVHLWWLRHKEQWVRGRALLEVCVVAAVTAVVSFPLPLLRSTSTVVLRQMFQRCSSGSNGAADDDLYLMCDPDGEWTDYSLRSGVFLNLLVAGVVRFALFTVSFGMLLPAGCFVPSLTVGAIVGRVVGLIFIRVNYWLELVKCHKCIHPGVYAVVGAAATLGGTTRNTISIVVIMFELTGGLSYVVPFMVAVMVAKWAAEGLYSPSISEASMAVKGMPQLQLSRHDVVRLRNFRVSDVMTTKVVVIVAKGNTLRSLEEKVARYSHEAFPVISSKEERLLWGVVQRCALSAALARIRAEHQWATDRSGVTFSGGDEDGIDLSALVNRAALALPLSASLVDTVHLFQKMDLRVCPVQLHGTLQGLVTRVQLGRFVGRYKSIEGND